MMRKKPVAPRDPYRVVRQEPALDMSLLPAWILTWLPAIPSVPGGRVVTAELPEDRENLPAVTGKPKRKVGRPVHHDLPLAGSNARRIYDYLLRQHEPVLALNVARALRLPVEHVRPALSNLRTRVPQLATSSGKMPYMLWRAAR